MLFTVPRSVLHADELGIFGSTSSAVLDVGTRNRTVMYMYHVHFAVQT